MKQSALLGPLVGAIIILMRLVAVTNRAPI